MDLASDRPAASDRVTRGLGIVAQRWSISTTDLLIARYEPRDATLRLVIKISTREVPFDRYHMAMAFKFGASWRYELSILAVFFFYIYKLMMFQN